VTSAFTLGAQVRLLLRSRAFALADPPPDAELCALLELGEAAAALDPALAIELSSITTPWLRSVFPPDERAVANFETRSGLRFSVDASDVFAATIAAGHLREALDFEAFMSLVRPGAVIVDVGANFGLYALSAALYARPAGQIFAFEPAPGAFAMLERNIADNGLEVTAIAAAIGAARARAKFLVTRDVSFSSLFETNRSHDATPIEVEVATLDAALSDVKAIDLLKIDVEGGEAAVLAGARDLLGRSHRAIVQFEYSHKNLSPERYRELRGVIASLQALGFKLRRRAAESADLPAFDEAFSGNLFLVREGESDRRLRDALAKSHRRPAQRGDLAALALLKRQAEQKRALREAYSAEKTMAEIAVSVVGSAAPLDPVEAMRAVQTAWLEARKRAADAEGAVSALAESVKGRDQLISVHNDKIAALRRNITALEERLESLGSERDGTIEKVRRLREANARILERNTQLEAALKASSAKIAALRDADSVLRTRLHELMAQHKSMQGELARVRNVAKRMADRNDALRAAVDPPPDDSEAGERAAT
jgi:FkbM family methyltransferase